MRSWDLEKATGQNRSDRQRKTRCRWARQTLAWNCIGSKWNRDLQRANVCVSTTSIISVKKKAHFKAWYWWQVQQRKRTGLLTNHAFKTEIQTPSKFLRKLFIFFKKVIMTTCRHGLRGEKKEGKKDAVTPKKPTHISWKRVENPVN